MSTNYYVRTPQTPEGDEGIHLGKSAGGWAFSFRGYPDGKPRPAQVTWEVADFDSWMRLLSLGIIFTEAGSTLTRDEMIATALDRPVTWHPLGHDQFEDRDGNHFSPYEFC